LKGNPGILDSTRIGFFCSVRCPGDVILKTYDLARMLRETDAAIVGGFQSPMEKECLDMLLRGSTSVVVCPARGIGNMRIPKSWQDPLAQGRLLILSFFADRIRRPTAALAAQRNAYIAALADRILVAHAEKGGKTEALCKEALAAGKPVFAIGSPDNAHLVDLGIVPVQAEALAPLL
jgi:predicted Rossmann fold nucleotide-binding protein DprA/Smf involved in DNA uptake